MIHKKKQMIRVIHTTVKKNRERRGKGVSKQKRNQVSHQRGGDVPVRNRGNSQYLKGRKIRWGGKKGPKNPPSIPGR